MTDIINRVAQSSLVDFNLEEYYPKGERILFDLREFLYQDAIIKEKEFRQQLKAHDWTRYDDNHVAINCSVDVIIPSWSYMLVAGYLEAHALTIIIGNLEELESYIYNKVLERIDWEKFRDAKVIVKGCSNLPVPESAYVDVVRLLKPVASSIMYGEACSSVPIFKKNINI